MSKISCKKVNAQAFELMRFGKSVMAKEFVRKNSEKMFWFINFGISVMVKEFCFQIPCSRVPEE